NQRGETVKQGSRSARIFVDRVYPPPALSQRGSLRATGSRKHYTRRLRRLVMPPRTGKTSIAVPDLDEVLITRKSERAARTLEMWSEVVRRGTFRWRVRDGEQVEHELGNHIRRWEVSRLDLRGTRVDPQVITTAALLSKLPGQ